ncbi:MAG: mannosyltransferase, partial [Actinobacteria bacterium]|nr:mannosyltransferase [Actinomycetota bacterium]
IVPLSIWLFTGVWRDKPGARILGWVWVGVTFVSVPSLLALAEPGLWQFSRPWYQAWAGLIYVIVAMATLGWMVVTGRRVAVAADPGIK